LIVAIARYLRNTGGLESRNLLFAASAALLVVVLISYALDLRRKKADEMQEQRETIEAGLEFDPFAGGFPVPPMPGQIAQPSRRTKATISSGAATQVATETTEGTNV
jgi:NADH-quinone oxidoreductase subunit H